MPINSLVKLHYFQLSLLKNSVYKKQKKSIKDQRNFCLNTFFKVLFAASKPRGPIHIHLTQSAPLHYPNGKFLLVQEVMLSIYLIRTGRNFPNGQKLPERAETSRLGINFSNGKKLPARVVAQTA